ncbi:MAG TPA: nucleotidyltransferase family protein [Thermodesulfovibrionales bacterium]|nr:nucleotidyltransferase family protein [Thermodesulfovibrionales bacterium]
MGKLKQLLPLGDRPAVLRCLESIRGAGIDDIVLVVGHDSQEIMGVIEEFPAKVVCNAEPETGMYDSVRLGLGKVDPSASGVFICLADQPLVKADTLLSMRFCHEEKPDMIIIPLYRGMTGHPPLLPKRILIEVELFPTLRDLIQRHAEEVLGVEVADEGVVLDMDTWEDYERMLECFRQEIH